MNIKKVFRNLALLSVIPIGGFAAAVYYQTIGASEGTFCGHLVNKQENKEVLLKFYARDKASFDGNAYRYGTETKYYMNFKKCSINSSYVSCWNDLAKSEIVTVKDQIELFLATGAILHHCSIVQTDIVYRR